MGLVTMYICSNAQKKSPLLRCCPVELCFNNCCRVRSIPSSRGNGIYVAIKQSIYPCIRLIIQLSIQFLHLSIRLSYPCMHLSIYVSCGSFKDLYSPTKIFPGHGRLFLPAIPEDPLPASHLLKLRSVTLGLCSPKGCFTGRDDFMAKHHPPNQSAPGLQRIKAMRKPQGYWQASSEKWMTSLKGIPKVYNNLNIIY